MHRSVFLASPWKTQVLHISQNLCKRLTVAVPGKNSSTGFCSVAEESSGSGSVALCSLPLSVVQWKAPWVRSSAELCPGLLSLPGSRVLFVCVSLFHTCFEAAREDNASERREGTALFFPFIQMLGRIQAGVFQKTKLYQEPSWLLLLSSALYIRPLFCIDIPHEQTRKVEFKNRKRDSVIVASLLFMWLLLLPPLQSPGETLLLFQPLLIYRARLYELTKFSKPLISLQMLCWLVRRKLGSCVELPIVLLFEGN